MIEDIKKRLEWIKEDDTLIVREIQDSATLCKLLRINAHLTFIYKALQELCEQPR